MDKPNPHELPVYRSEQFRIPSRAERELWLWVDRIGESRSGSTLDRLRILGQYCHVIVLEGSGVYTSREHGTHDVRAGDCMVQFPNDPCAYYPHGQWRTRWITWNGHEGEPLNKLGYITTGDPVFQDENGSISRTYDLLKPIMQRGDRADALRRKTLVLQMLLSLHDTQKRIAGTSLGYPRMEEALQILHSRFDRDIPITALAAEIGLSPTHFRRRFRAYTGRTPLEYIVDLRIAEAKRLLREGQPIKAVAAKVGYDDHFYFMRVFKKTVGTPPGAYARRFA